MIPCRSSPGSTFVPESDSGHRNDILLPKSPFSYIVIGKRGFTVWPDQPLFTRTNLATSFTPPSKPPKQHLQ
jgi:hypothetical protein